MLVLSAVSHFLKNIKNIPLMKKAMSFVLKIQKEKILRLRLWI